MQEVQEYYKKPQKFDDGVYTISNDEYHSSFAFSRSSILNFLRSPFHFREFLSHKKSQSAQMGLGNMLHTLVLEPDTFDERYAVRPNISKATKIGKLAYNQFVGTLMGREEVKEEDVKTARVMASSILNDKYASQLLTDFTPEESIYFTHETGIQCKVRPDAWKREEGIILDLKTTKSATLKSFQSSAIDLGYFLQAAMTYKACLFHKLPWQNFVILAVENTFPYATAIYLMDEEAIEFGVEQFDLAMNNLLPCLLENKAPSYPVRTLSVPRWASVSEDLAGIDE